MNNKDDVRRIDTIMYILSLSLSAFRFARKQAPFDFENSTVAQYMTSVSMPFISDESCPYEDAHLQFVQSMLEDGWQCGPEDFINKIHPALTDWENLSTEMRDLYGYVAAVVCSAKGFYESLKADLLKEFMDNLPALAIRGKLIIPDSRIFRKATH
jgi:hypothetical protein